MKEFPFKTVFSSTVKPIISKEYNLQLAKASLEQLRGFIPDINPEINYDLLPIAVPLFNVNYFNKNDDGVDTTFALKVYKTFINKFLDLNHKRDLVVGTILSAHITEFGTDKPLTEDDVKNTKDIFNIIVGGILWKSVNEGLTECIEESNNILSENFDKIKASLEVGFTDYKLVKCPANSRALTDGIIIEDIKEIEELSKHLKAFGGTGKLKDGSRVFRLLSGEGLGLGGAITESPAAFLNAIAVPEINTDHNKENNERGDTIENREKLLALIKLRGNTLFSLQEALDRVGKIADEVDTKIISHLQTSNVINNKNSNNSNLRENMKITNIKDITDDLLKEVTASSLVDFVETELKTASEKFAKEKQEKETLAQELQKKHDDLIKTYETLNKDLEILKATLQKLEQEKIAKEKQEKFTVRMSSFEDKFELTQEELSVVGSQIRDLSDEQYKNVETNLYILLKNKDRQVIAESKKAREVKASENKEVKVEQSAQQTVDSALNQAVNISKEIPATTIAQTQTLKEKYAKAFSIDEFTFIK